MKAFHAMLSVITFTLAGSAVAGDEPYPESVISAVGPAKGRAQVAAEAREAVRLGLLSFGEGDAPSLKSDVSAAGPAKDRVQVAAEAREAVRLGLLSFGEGDPPIATPEQERLIAEAGRRAVEQVLLAGKAKR